MEKRNDSYGREICMSFVNNNNRNEISSNICIFHENEFSCKRRIMNGKRKKKKKSMK